MGDIQDRVFNFSAGPSVLPVEVLREAQADLLNWNGSGMSVMEMSHRGKAFEGILQKAEADLRALMGIPESYKVLFLQGGASLQFTMVPMNLLRQGETADYVVTGSWGKKALQSAKLVGQTRVVWDGKDTNYDRLPNLSELQFTEGAAYIHVTSNETIQGVEFQGDPELPAPVVCDMSSDILSRPLDVSRYALIYAGAQKNMGPAGVTVVIVREDLLARTPENFHPMLDYRLQAENASLYNTPPCWCIYICGLVYQHLLRSGGLEAALQRNRRKAALVYDAIDRSGGFYKGHAQRDCRSLMNVTFTLPSEELTKAFLEGAKAHKLDGLKGHRSVGGCRASIYNAFPEEGCRVLADYMDDFAKRHG
ncbi:MAG: 3-phosphoserine/phosphohydroxythreonine transaminase [Fimbriimonadales bacterium]|nr:3-phosphoserine/phosphohydroxythreonine transaminase [Fimbriimonadales bacterium]